MLFIATPRSTTTKQFDCWIIMRSTGTVEPSLYCVKVLYQGVFWSSTTAKVPSDSLQCSSCGLAFSAVAPPAPPVATVPPPPRVGDVPEHPASTAAAIAASAARAVILQ